MNVLRLFLLLFILISFNQSFASPTEQCLSQIGSKHHIIESDELILSCFNKYKSTVGSKSCFQLANNFNKIKKTYLLSEKIKTICFYEASIFQNISSCLLKTKEFKNADNRDEAVFDCYRQFHNTLNEEQCLKATKYLTYPAKKDYLLQQCYYNIN